MPYGTESAKQLAFDEIRADRLLAPPLALWMEKAGETGLPRPRDIDPLALPPSILSSLLIFDIVDGGARFRFRLVGTAVVGAIGADFTGTYLDEAISGDLLTVSLERYRLAIAKRRPVYAYAEYVQSDGQNIKNCLLILPLSIDGTTVDRLLVAFSPRSEWLARVAVKNVKTGAPDPLRSMVVL